jgi:hypothetical protein
MGNVLLERHKKLLELKAMREGLLKRDDMTVEKAVVEQSAGLKRYEQLNGLPCILILCEKGKVRAAAQRLPAMIAS